MNISKFIQYVFVFFLPVNLMASPIPTYEIAEISSTILRLTNDASFILKPYYWEKVNDWEVGDQIELIHTDRLFDAPIAIVEGRPLLEPILLISNLTKEATAHGYLAEEPTLDLVTIVSLDLEAKTILLSDSGVWDLSETDQGFFNIWNPGDPILFGISQSIESPLFRQILLNANHAQVARARLH